MRLQKIPADRFAQFIEARFKASGIKAAAGLGAAIVELAGNLPYDVQRLAHEVWDDARGDGRRTADLDDLHATLQAAAGRARDALRRHVAATDARAARRPAGGGARGRTRAALSRRRDRAIGSAAPRPCRPPWRALLREDIIAREGDRYVVVDSLFREWVARRTF